MPHPARILRKSALWFTEGRARKDEARRERRCVECGTGLPSRRTPYCGRRCQWRFQGHYFWDAARTYVIHRDRFTCRACRVRHRVRNLEVDHILEIARGGPPLSYENLQTLCRSCHREKTIRFLHEMPRHREAFAGGALPSERSLESDWFPA